MSVPLLVKHDQGCRYARPSDGAHSDAAKRVADGYNLHRVARGMDAVGSWGAFRLQDGVSDGVLYDSKLDAVVHQRQLEKYYLFVPIKMCSMSVCEAESLIYTARMFYRMGNHQADSDHPQGGREVIPRLTREDQLSMLAAMFFGGKPANLLPPRSPGR